MPPWRGSAARGAPTTRSDRKSTRLNSSHGYISYAVFCLKKKNLIDYVHHRRLPTHTRPVHFCRYPYGTISLHPRNGVSSSSALYSHSLTPTMPYSWHRCL